ncbi:flagellar hook-length control protein FliK [Bradyrhizobium sp. CCBAU 53415]|uniref:flagellar hook-length control protein FliK n=1 Tax=Bradyrhizobium sp. CCBAU 53415 TaxID=1325119 RepID=UPI002305BB49|nr:flagellar hook-length control protein FliK [Bradyrhizobium sp. CCBAU 53415]MDA9467136.1 flagellar hook-length control protein FliK [Bradyrhizobium sp. CCBAU 53415]
MTKLSGTSGQLFSGLAESLNTRGTSRSARSAGTKSQANSSFNDLLRTVSSLAKQALSDDGSDTTAKTGTLRTRLAHPTEEKKGATVRERIAASEGPESTEESSDETADRSSETPRPVDHAAGSDVQGPSGIAVVVGQEIAAAPAVKTQMQLQSADKDALARDGRSSTAKREAPLTGAATAATADTAPSSVAPNAARSQAAASQAMALQPASTQGGEASRAMPASAGFEAVTATVERAAKASARAALPETTKVTVVQQETHLPPAQFNAPQQVANAVVAELKESSAPAASASPDLAASRTNAPDQPLKILTVNLEPPALGNVTVRLRLVGTEVSVQLAAERRDTSQMLDQQRDQIRDLVQSAGYVADVAPVRHGSLDGFQSGSGQSQPQLPGQPSSQSQGAFGGPGTSSGQSDGGARQARQERQSNQETRHDQDVGQQNRRGPVYL